MKQGHLIAVGLVAAGTVSISATAAFAYVGPGAGLSAVGAFLALIIGVILAFVGFVWYPLKRLLRKGKAAGVSSSEPLQKPQTQSAEESA